MTRVRFRTKLALGCALALLAVTAESATACRRCRRVCRRPATCVQPCRPTTCPPVPCPAPCAPAPEVTKAVAAPPCICIRQKIRDYGSLKIYRANQHVACADPLYCNSPTPCLHADPMDYLPQECNTPGECINSPPRDFSESAPAEGEPAPAEGEPSAPADGEPSPAMAAPAADVGDTEIQLPAPMPHNYNIAADLAPGWRVRPGRTGWIYPPVGPRMRVKYVILESTLGDPIAFGFGYEVTNNGQPHEFAENANYHGMRYRYEFKVRGVPCFIIASR